MAPLRCCTFNCRGWNSGLLSLNNYNDSLDICFIQEHWLHHDHLHKIREISLDFTSVRHGQFITISWSSIWWLLNSLYRKSLSTCITPLDSCSSRFCGIKIHDSSGLSLLLVSVYMPSEIGSLNEYLSTLGELEGFIDSHPCDNTFLVGDFNVDFTCGGPLKDLLTDFVSIMCV